MIIDTSAVPPVLFREPDAQSYDAAIASSQRCRMSATSFLEASIVLESRRGPAAGPTLNAYLEGRRPTLNRCHRGTGPSHPPCLATLWQGQPPSGPEVRRPLRLRAHRGQPCCSRATISRLPTSKLLDALKLRDWVTSRGTFVGALSAPPRQLTRLEEARASTRFGLEPCHPSGRGLEVVAGAGHAAPWGRLGR